MRRLAVTGVLGLLLVLAVVTPAMAADAATARIRGFFTEVNRVLADPQYEDRLPERLAAIRAMVLEIVDFGQAAEVALGVEWAVRTRAEREEFVRLFTDLLQTSVFAMVGGRARIDNGLIVTYVGELNDGDGVTVATSVLTRSGAEMAVGYRMARRTGRWMVRDVVVDGVSLVENYRAQFQKVIQRSSYAGLVGEMRTRLAEMGRPAETVSAPQRTPVTVVTAAPPANGRGATAPEPSPAPIPAAPPQPLVVAAAPPAASETAPAAPDATTARPAVPAHAASAPPAAPPHAAPLGQLIPVPPAAPSTSRIVAAAPPAPAPRAPAPALSAPAAPSGALARSTPPAEPVPVQTVRVAPMRVTAAPAARAVTPPVHSASLWIQVGAFREVERAITVVTALSDQAVSLISVPGEPLMRVVVGPFADRAAAAAKLRELRRRGYDAFIAAPAK